MQDAVIERAVAVLAAAGDKPAIEKPTRRYVHSRDHRRGIRIWATSKPSSGTDLIGLQFYGAGRSEGERLEAALDRVGFFAHSRDERKLTFAKSVAFAPDGAIDRRAVARVRQEIDALIGRKSVGAPVSGGSFRDFMLASPLAEVELPTVSRKGEWRESQV